MTVGSALFERLHRRADYTFPRLVRSRATSARPTSISALSRSFVTLRAMNRAKKGKQSRSPFPDFLGIGAQRSGTSWLAKNLSRHPDVWLPYTKELHYFDQRIKEPPFGGPLARSLTRNVSTDDWYPWVWRYQLKLHLQRYRKKIALQNALWDLRFFGRSPSDKWYASLFGQGQGKITGEITPEYAILDEEVVAHIHALMPNAK